MPRYRFLSTLSLRRATVGLNLVGQMEDISIHALLAESDVIIPTPPVMIPISIHALLAESDVSIIQLIECGLIFLSTLSLRRATERPQAGYHSRAISIHALLAESDGDSHPTPAHRRYFYPRSPCGERPGLLTPLLGRRYFYPRSPCGERPLKCRRHLRGRRFLSTLSLRRATKAQDEYKDTVTISIHALLAESDGRAM